MRIRELGSDQQRSLKSEALAMPRQAEPIKQPLEDVSREYDIEGSALRASQREKARPNRRPDIPPALGHLCERLQIRLHRFPHASPVCLFGNLRGCRLPLAERLADSLNADASPNHTPIAKQIG